MADHQLSVSEARGLNECVTRAGDVVHIVEQQLGKLRRGEIGIGELRGNAKGVLVCAGRLEEFYEGLIRYS